jgi:gliding motility-associated-like protein
LARRAVGPFHGEVKSTAALSLETLPKAHSFITFIVYFDPTVRKPCILYPILLLIPFLCVFSSVKAQGNSCADTSYRMRFSSPGKEFRFYTHCNTPDWGTVLIGYMADTGTATNNNIVVLKLDATGRVTWKTAISDLAGNGTYFSRIIEQSNGELAAFGYTQAFNSNVRQVILLKFSATGSLLWSNKLSLNSQFAPNDMLHPYFLSEGLNHDLLLTIGGSHNDANADSTYAVMARINNAGTIAWSKAFTNDPFSFGMNPSGIYEKNGDIFTFGYVDNVVGYCGTYTVTPYAIKMSYATGQPLLTKAYCHPYPQSNASELGLSAERDFYNSVRLLDGQFALYGRFQNVTDRRYGYKIIFDEQLNLVKALQYDVPRTGGSSLGSFSVLADGSAHFFYFGTNTASKQFYWASFDSTGKISRQRKMTLDQAGTGFGGYLTFGYRNSDTYTFSTFYRLSNQRYSLFTQLQRNDPTIDSCLGTDTTFAASNTLGWSQTTWTWKGLVDDPLITTPLALTTADFLVNTESLCTQISRCDSLHISGADTLCVTDNFISFTALKNQECHKRVLWSINDPLVDSLFQPNDTTLTVRFKQLTSVTPQTLRLEASAANCTIAKDTAAIVLLPGLRSLPPDTVVCADFSLRLTPGKWGKNYRWQDGSTDSVFLAKDTGRYVVSAETLCGGFFSDTIYIGKPVLKLSADRTTICQGDTIVLRATPGFTNYRWLQQPQLSLVSDSLAKGFPIDTTTYSVSAQTTLGCMVQDSIRINVLHSPPINLGIDTSFCEGASLNLKVPAGFSSYRWSNGNTSPAVTITNSGLYWLKATDNNGCSSADTITVLPLHKRPVVFISPKDIVCIGQSDTLRVTSSFSRYQWNTGDSDSYQAVSTTGRYWITVTDANGCKGSDTAVITKMALPPKGFLPTDTTICSGMSVELKPTGTFQYYKWSNGASTSSIQTTTAGLYLLQVIDYNHCTGTDSMQVIEKPCPNKIFFPSAFTPNGDGRNDLFKPFVQGSMKTYQLTVYNRWGQVVFRSTDFHSGWNDSINNLLQDNGIFVWLCTYQFAGEQKKTLKGVLTLIK